MVSLVARLGVLDTWLRPIIIDSHVLYHVQSSAEVGPMLDQSRYSCIWISIVACFRPLSPYPVLMGIDGLYVADVFLEYKPQQKRLNCIIKAVFAGIAHIFTNHIVCLGETANEPFQTDSSFLYLRRLNAIAHHLSSSLHHLRPWSLAKRSLVSTRR